MSPPSQPEELVDLFMVAELPHNSSLIHSQIVQDLKRFMPYILKQLAREDAFVPLEQRVPERADHTQNDSALPKRSFWDRLFGEPQPITAEPVSFDSQTRSSSVRNSPGSRLLHLFTPGSCQELKPVLQDWLIKGDRDIWRQISRQLVAFASDDVVPSVSVLFEHSDQFIAGAARSGAMDGVKKGRAEPAFLAYVRDHCVALIESGAAPSMNSPVRLLWVVDREALAEVLPGDVVLNGDPSIAAEGIYTLREMERPLDPQVLLRLARSAMGNEKRDPVWIASVDGLIAHGDDRVMELINAALDDDSSVSELVETHAMRARSEVSGASDPWDIVVDEDSYQKLDELNDLDEEVRAIVLLDVFLDQLGPSGFQFFEWWASEWDEYSVDVVEALHFFEAREHAQILEDVHVAQFGVAIGEERQEIEVNHEAVSKLEKDWQNLPSLFRVVSESAWKRHRANRDHPA
ncbi:MAG: hypothetical protein R3F19_15140 [Verrucomicrobiales bacterium]